MMGKKGILFLAVSIVTLFSACGDDDETDQTIKVNFNALTANGSDAETTTTLTLTFDKDVAGLTTDNVTLTAGNTGATKGELTSKGSGVYELAVKDIAAEGEVTVKVAKENIVFTPESKSVAVHMLWQGITDQALIAAIERSAKVTFVKDDDGSVNVARNKEIIEGITYLNVGNKELSTLAGIEYFVNLTELRCQHNQLQTLDLTNNTKLETITCDANHLKVLDLTAIVNVNWMSSVFGLQTTDDGRTSQNLTLTVTESQKTKMDSDGWTPSDYNEGVTVSVKK